MRPPIFARERTPVHGEFDPRVHKLRKAPPQAWVEAAAERVREQAPAAAAAAASKAGEVRAIAEQLRLAIAELTERELAQARLRALLREPEVVELLGEPPTMPRYGGLHPGLLKLLERGIASLGQ